MGKGILTLVLCIETIFLDLHVQQNKLPFVLGIEIRVIYFNDQQRTYMV